MTKFVLYLIVTFAGLFLGGLFTNPGTASEWYLNLNQAPWIPPGWVFGFAWTLIGITWSVWAAKMVDKRTIYFEYYYCIWILNFVWNPIFFVLNDVLFAGLTIAALLVLVADATIATHKECGWRGSIWGIPYVLWLVVANSLNWYVFFAN